MERLHKWLIAAKPIRWRLLTLVVLLSFSGYMIGSYTAEQIKSNNAEDIADSFCKALEKTAPKLPVEECRGVAGRPK